MFQLLTIGDPIIDTHVQIDNDSAEIRVIPHENLKLCLDYGSKIPILNSFQSLGGNACNVAVGAVKLGLKTAILATVGSDVNGQIAQKELASYGVDTSYLATDPKATTRYSIVLNYREERTILSFSDHKRYHWPKHLAAEWIYYTGLSDGYQVLQKELIAYLRKNTSTHLAFNPGSYLLKYAADDVCTILKRTNILIVNVEEAESILKTTLAKERNVGVLVRKLLAKGPKEVVVTQAERGAWAGTSREIWHHKAFPIKVVAKTGAGDAFSAGYLAARFYKHPIKEALAWGTANSAGVIGAHGPHAGLLGQTGIKKQLALFPHTTSIRL